ncbi:MAG: enterotoxin, partial [Pseudonocardiaceae bacterium]
MLNEQPWRVVVVGASLAGLFAAAATAGRGNSVTVLERDVLPSDPQPRAGVPQGEQPHVFLFRGLLALEELLPGSRQELLGVGAVPLDTGDLPWLAAQGWL